MENSERWRTYFGKQVRDQRKSHDLSQASLAKLLKEKGFSAAHPSTVAKVEAGDRAVTIDEAVAYSTVFNVSIDKLLGHRARPVGDRDFVLRRLAESVNDAHRAWRVSLRDIADRCAELADVDEQGRYTSLIATVQGACDKLADDAGELAQIAGQIAETRGHRARWHAVRVEDE